MLRFAPLDLRVRMFYWVFRGRRDHYRALFDGASLHHAPSVSMQLMPTDEGHACIAFTGVYELDLTRRLVAIAKRGGTLVDVGANYGYYSLLWAAQHESNRAVAYEASPRNFGQLSANVQSNGFADRVALHDIALGRAAGRLAFDLGPVEQSGWGGLASAATNSTVEVEVQSLDAAWQSDNDIDVLKIDVEGADSWVLHGARQLLVDRRIKAVFYEENKPRMRILGIAPGEAERLLLDVGYRVHALSDRRRDLVEFAAYPALDA